MTPDAYQEWRKTIPFTDEDVALVMDAESQRYGRAENQFMSRKFAAFAARVRRGHLRSLDVAFVLPFLIKRCAICGAKALYRTGVEGRCSEHRLIPSRAAIERRRRLDEASASYSDAVRSYDDWDGRRRALKGTRIGRRR